MAAPRADSYTAASGGVVYGGRAASRPAWRRAMGANTWAVVPTANSLSSLDPKTDPAVNPVYPSSPNWYAAGHEAIVSAWCGACYDSAGDVLWLPLGGGHSDYAGNEPYKLALKMESPTWTRVRNPSGAIGNLLTINDGQEATGIYSDGQPRAIHSYNKPVYVPNVGPYIAVQGNTSLTAAGGTRRPVAVDAATGLGTLKADNAYAGSSSGGGACFDPTRGALGSIWWRGAATNAFCRYDVSADTWVQVGGTYTISGYTSLCYLPDADCILWGNDGGTAWAVIDCSTGARHTPTFSGSVSGSLRPGSCQTRWVAELGSVCAWDNSTNTTLITRLTPGANPRTDAWTIDSITVSGSNAVTPTTRAANGTYGRFAYSQNLGGFLVLNATNQSPYFFSLD